MAQFNAQNTPFSLSNTNAYQEWREWKLKCAASSINDLIVEINDPHQITNVAGETKHYRTLNKLRDQLLKELQETNDPRVLDNGDAFDNYPYYGKLDNPLK